MKFGLISCSHNWRNYSHIGTRIIEIYGQSPYSKLLRAQTFDADATPWTGPDVPLQEDGAWKYLAVSINWGSYIGVFICGVLLFWVPVFSILELLGSPLCRTLISRRA